jgi:hypothetical protein
MTGARLISTLRSPSVAVLRLAHRLAVAVLGIRKALQRSRK